MVFISLNNRYIFDKILYLFQFRFALICFVNVINYSEFVFVGLSVCLSACVSVCLSALSDCFVFGSCCCCFGEGLENNQ